MMSAGQEAAASASKPASHQPRPKPRARLRAGEIMDKNMKQAAAQNKRAWLKTTEALVKVCCCVARVGRIPVFGRAARRVVPASQKGAIIGS
jgi:hypothetical protein